MCLHIYRGMKILTSVRSYTKLMGFLSLGFRCRITEGETTFHCLPHTHIYSHPPGDLPTYRGTKIFNIQYAKHSRGLFPFAFTVVSWRRENSITCNRKTESYIGQEEGTCLYRKC